MRDATKTYILLSNITFNYFTYMKPLVYRWVQSSWVGS